jgi:hypothetical protein
MSRITILVCVAVAAFSVSAQEGGPPKLTMDTSLYPYLSNIDNDVDATITTRAILPGRFSYFGYVNVTGVVTGGSAAFARSEQNLRYTMSDKLPLDLALQGVLVGGDGDDFYQLGVSWRIHDTAGWRDFFARINLIYRMNFQLKRYSVDDSGAWQMEHFFKMTFPKLSDRLYLSGFVDQTFNQNLPDTMPSSPIIAEVQLGARVWKNFYAVAEYRINQRRVGDEENLAIGIEYKARW